MATHSRILAWRIPMDRGAWRAAVHRVTELDTTEMTQLSHTLDYTHPLYHGHLAPSLNLSPGSLLRGPLVSRGHVTHLYFLEVKVKLLSHV